MRTVSSLGVPGTWVPSVHANCPHNEVAAILKRSLAPLPVQVFEPLGVGVLHAFADMRHLARKYVDGSWGYLQTALSYNGRLQRRYVEAARSLRVDGPLTKEDWYLRPFLKAEKFNGAAKVAKPRLIYPRSPRYNLALATRLKPFEHWLWGRLTARTFSTGGVGRVVAKGLNPVERANLIRRKMLNLDDCVVVEADGAAFEAHVGPYQLKEEHSVYLQAFPGDRGLRKLLRAQRRLEGTLPCGAKFSRDGGRASGDFNTGMGNSLVMLAVVVGVLSAHKVPYDLLVDGDNALVFLRGVDSSRVMRTFASDVLSCSGQEVTLERPVRVLEEVRFGRSAPVFAGGSWRMVRDYRSVLSGALSSHRWLREPGFVPEWIRGVASCELSLARGVPVLQSWALGLQREWGGPEGVRAHPHTDLLYKGAWFAAGEESLAVSLEARLSFERAFGLTPEAQVWLERALEAPANLGRLAWTRVALLTFDHNEAPPGVIEAYKDCPDMDAWLVGNQ